MDYDDAGAAAASTRRSRTSAARSSRARSRSRERAQEMSAMLGDHDAALAEAERKAAAAKERRRARSKSRERSAELEDRIGAMDGGNSVRSTRRDRARSRSRERVNELEKEIEEAEAKAAAAKERRRARSRSRERTMDLERALDEDDQNATAAANRSVRSAARSRARSRSRERAAELAKELERDDAAGAGHAGGGGRIGGRVADVSDERRQRARSRSKERVSAFEQRIKEREERQKKQQEAAKSRSRTTPSDARSRGGDTHASEEYDKFNADAELPKRPPMLEPSAKGDKPASQLNIYNSMGAISAISDVSDSATEDMTDTSAADHHAHHHGRSSGVRGGSLASRGSSSRAGGGSGGRAGASGNAGSGGGGEQFSPNLPPNLHTSLAKCDWPAFHRALQHLSQSPSLIIPSVSMTDPENPNDSTTPLHTACWKAPPTLALMLIRLLPSSRELSGIFTARDGDDNTALHLCCANLERMVDGDSSGASGGINTSVLEALVKAAPRALKMQNAEGDTPLQMLVSSSACLPKTWDLSPESRNYDSAGISSEHVLNLLLNAGGGEEAIMKDMTGATPLHVAIAAGAHGRVIDTLIAAAPQALKMPDNRGMLPMHYVAAFCRTPMASVKRMLEIYGDALFAHTTNGDTPLHLLVSNSSNIIQAKSNRAGDDSKDEGPVLDRNMVRIVEALMGPADGGRSPLIMTNREKLTPLHCCALFDAPPRLSQLLMTHPSAKEASAMANSFGATPLHLASAQPSVAQSIATVLAVGTPEAAAVKDRLKRTPLHVASQNVHATPHLIKALAQLHPQATAEKTQRGHLPLHLAAQSQAKETVIKALIKAYPKATQAKNKSSNTPLHDAAKYRASVGAVKLLLETYPDAVYIQNQYGNLPIHCACAYQAPKDVVSLLLGAYPKGASTQNRNRDTPIHYTAAYATDPATVDPLIDAAPGALLLVNSSGQTPVDRAKANNAPKEIVALLEDRAADAEASGAGRTMQEDSWGEGEFDNARPFQ